MLSTLPADAMSLYRWKYRPVVVFAGAGTDPAIAEQQRIFARSRSGLAERDIVIVWVTGDTIQAELGPGPGLTANQLRARFGAGGSGFRIVLVGKDGGTKLTRSTPIGLRTLFATIDAMPMRRDEMRRDRP
jgi:hypothetical protein